MNLYKCDLNQWESFALLGTITIAILLKVGQFIWSYTNVKELLYILKNWIGYRQQFSFMRVNYLKFIKENLSKKTEKNCRKKLKKEVFFCRNPFNYLQQNFNNKCLNKLIVLFLKKY